MSVSVTRLIPLSQDCCQVISTFTATSPIVFLLCTSWISLTAILYFSEILLTHPNAWFIVCLSVTLSQFVENTNSVQKKETNTHFPSSLWSISMWMLNSHKRNSISLAKDCQQCQQRGLEVISPKWPRQTYHKEVVSCK